MPDCFALRGTFAHTPTPEKFAFAEDSYLVCENGVVAGIFKELPEKYQNIPVDDYSGPDKIIIPGMCDMHLHAPQYGFRGIGVCMEGAMWETWFTDYCFPEETKYKDLAYAEKAYDRLVTDMMQTTTTRFCMNATIHREATGMLMQKLEDAGFAGYVGKVNMDRNSSHGLIETTEETLAETRRWIEDCKGRFTRVLPMITPRYTPCCTDECMEGLSGLMKEYRLPVQTHLSEDLDEIEWVKRLKPEVEYYAQAYDMYDMCGSVTPTVMAHCVFPTKEEFDLLVKNQVMIAHCPYCNATCTTAYAAPILEYMRAGARVGLGSDMSGGPMLNLWYAMSMAMLASKMRWGFLERQSYKDPVDCVTLSQAFYLATKGGGSFWGKMGSFEEGYAFDAVVIDESRNRDLNERPLRDRMERLALMADERETYAKYIDGRKVYQA